MASSFPSQASAPSAATTVMRVGVGTLWGFGLALGLLLSGRAEAQSEPHAKSLRVIVVVPPGVMSDSQTTQLEKSLQLYLQDFEVQLQCGMPLSEVPDLAAHQAAAQALQSDGQFVVWLARTAGRSGDLLRLSVRRLEGANEELAEFTMRLPVHLQPAFYRQLGLKLRSTLWISTVAEAAPTFVATPAQLPEAVTQRPTVVQAVAAPVADDAFWLAGALGWGRVAAHQAGRAQGGVGFQEGALSVGVWASRTQPVRGYSSTGRARGVANQALLGVEFLVVASSEAELSLWLRTAAGVALYQVTGTAYATGQRRHRHQVLPVLSGALELRILAPYGVEVVLAPTLDMSMIKQEFLIQRQRVLASGTWLPQLGVGVRRGF